MTWVGIVNAKAGSRPRDIDEVGRIASDSGVDIRLVETDSEQVARGVVADAVAQGVDRFVAIGGDGTIHALINTLMGLDTDRRFTVGVVPSGSGSDLARTFGHGPDVHEAFVRIANPDLYGIDLGRVTFPDHRVRYFVNVADIGVAAAAVRTAARLPRRLGRARYTIAFWLALWRTEVPDVELHVDRHTFRGSAINIVVANGQFFGGGMNIAPRASMADGQFDVQVFTGRKRQAFSVMPRVLTGNHLTHRAVRRYIGSSVTVDGSPHLALESDGELIGAGPIRIDIVRDAIDLVI